MEYSENLAANWKPKDEKGEKKALTVTRFIAMNRELRAKVTQLADSMKRVFERNANAK